MGIIITILLGALVGWLASIITKRDAEQGWVGNIVVGIIGAFIGNVISSAVAGGNRSALAWDLSSLLWALGGAIALCVLINLFTRKTPV